MKFTLSRFLHLQNKKFVNIQYLFDKNYFINTDEARNITVLS